MSRPDTKTLVNLYYQTKKEETARKTKSLLDRPELYEFERKIGKELVDMNADDIIELVNTYVNNNFAKKNRRISYRTYDALLSNMRMFFDWYAYNYEVILNPCRDPRLRGKEADKTFAKLSKAITTKDYEVLLNKISAEYDNDRAIFYELIARLYYDGFYDSYDIVRLKRQDVDAEKNIALIRGNKIPLNKRTVELLENLYHKEDFIAQRGTYDLISYHDSYLKFPTRHSYVASFQDRPERVVCEFIDRSFINGIRNKLDFNGNGKTLYLLGLYNRMVAELGAKEVKRLLYSTRDSDAASVIMKYAKRYGCKEENVSMIKKILIPYVI